MTQIPDYSSRPAPAGLSDAYMGPAIELPTSGYAIASLVCGVVGAGTCCLFVPGVLAIVFGVTALSAIRRGEARGRGLAIAGIVLGIIAVGVGAIVWISGLVSPNDVATRQATVSEADRRALESMGVLQQDEEIKVLCTTGLVSVKAGGVVLTTRRLVLYDKSDTQACLLADICSIEYTPPDSFLDNGQFMIDRDDGEVMLFSIAAIEGGDRFFHRVLTRQVDKCRQAAGKPPATSELPSTGNAQEEEDAKDDVEEGGAEPPQSAEEEIADDESIPPEDAEIFDPESQTAAMLEACLTVVEEYQTSHKGLAPSKSEWKRRLIQRGIKATDAWGRSFRYDRIDKDRFEIRSAGEDGEFDTADDISFP